MELSGSKILVVGGAGFIGSHVVDHLLETDVAEVIVYDNFSSGNLKNLLRALDDERCSIFRDSADILDVNLLAEAVRGCHAVIHLAGLWLQDCQSSPRSCLEVNVGGTYNLLEASVNAGVERFIFSSSASVYSVVETTRISEYSPVAGSNMYSASKLSAESFCTAFANASHMKCINLRYMNVYGSRQVQKLGMGVVPALLSSILSGSRPLILGDGLQSYDFVNAMDVARANLLALTSDADTGSYNVGSGVGTNIKDLVDLLLRICSSDLIPEYRPYADDDVRQLVRRRIGSTLMAERDLGFKALIDLEDGLNELLQWVLASSRNENFR